MSVTLSIDIAVKLLMTLHLTSTMHLCIWHRALGTLSRVFTCWAPRSWYCFQYSAILKTLHYNALHSVVQILLHDEAQGTTPMHFYKCFPLRGQVSPIQAVSMGGSTARGLAILLDIHSQEIHFQETHFLEIVFWSKMSCRRISNPAGYSLSKNSFSENSLSGN